MKPNWGCLNKKTMTPEYNTITKIYFDMNEAVEIVGVEASCIRYWAKEFGLDTEIHRSHYGHRYRKFVERDLKNLLEIKRLLYEEGFAIRGAKRKFLETKIK